ncbi:MAG: VacJ family lipoprotein [Alphaproteobacteria bacterium]|nr:VacJ family lipoprotein [Alphaproteobacteria bacterium]
MTKIIRILIMASLLVCTSDGTAICENLAETAPMGVDNLISSPDLPRTTSLENEYESESEPDPLEPLNRVLYSINHVVDGLILKPVAILYRDTIPDAVKDATQNFIGNVFAPLTFINHTFQGEGERAMNTIFRFVINSTIGLLGVMDVAKEMGVPSHPTTLNHTFATWGMGTGPYLVIPVVGPSSFRAAYGMAGDMILNPVGYVARNKHQRHNRYGQQGYILWALYGLDAIDKRSKLIDALNDIEASSLDPYATVRSYYFQTQTALEKEIKTR